MSIIYDLIFLVFALFCLPAYLFRRKFHVGFAARLGILPRGPLPRKPIWIHAVSVGEAASVIGLIDELRRVMPAAKFVISTVTPTGNKIASRLAGEGDLVTYLPLDLSFIVRRVIRKIDPTLFVIVETEVWPNLISALHAARVPVVTVNGRISEASFKGYLAAGVLFRRIFNKISLFCVQSARDASRLLRLGVAEDKIKVTGNMKFDAAGGFTIKAGELIKCRQLLGLLPQDKLLVCGSTHEGEEEALLRIYRAISEGFAGLKLLLAP